MPGRTVLFAATAALTLLGASAASAGWYGAAGCCAPPLAANWGCASSGCAPLYMSSFSYGGCCAPVRWGCGSACGPSYSDYGYGVGYGGYNVAAPIHVVNQGPSYDLPLTGYTYPVATYDEPRAYPYVRGYNGYRQVYRPYGYRGYRGYGVARPFYRSRVAHFHRSVHVRYPGMRHAPRRGYRSDWMGK
jgi:hypothetical protein